jgi:Spy/CpxP family protein refolding chaperone
MRKIHLAALGAALVVGLGTTAAAQATQKTEHGHGYGTAQGGPGHDGARMDSALFRGLTLSDAQKSRITAIRQKYHGQMTALRDKARVSGQGDAQRQPPDSATRAQLRSLMEQQRTEVRGVLTPDQQKVYDQNVAEIRAHAQERMKNWKNQGAGAPKKSGPR